MITTAQRQLAGYLLSGTALLATIVMAPKTLYDPINLPKLAIIAIGAFTVLGILAINFKVLISKSYRAYFSWFAIFNANLLLVLLISDANNVKEFFGADGRSTGFLAYCSLSILLLASIVASNQANLQRFSLSLILALILSLIYGVLQFAGADPVGWNLMYNPIMGFLGNPNFQSSFLGIGSVFAFALALDGVIKLPKRFAFAGLICLSLFLIKESDSQQGFLVFVGGASIVFLVRLYNSRIKSLTIPGLIGGGVGFFLILFGTLNKGPLAQLLYKDSVTYRGDYWQAGWNMTTSNPIFGVGLDNYGDWYRRSRTLEATLRRGPEVTSNAAHNVFLDFSSNGGFPLLAVYLLLVLLVVRSSLRIISRESTFNPYIIGAIGAWIAYQAQSVISLNQLGLAVWGWILSGLIIGYDISSRETLVDSNSQLRPGGKIASNVATRKHNSQAYTAIALGFCIGLALVAPALVTSNTVRSANKAVDVETVKRAAYSWPHSTAVQFEIAYILANAKFHQFAEDLILVGLKESPDSFGLWRLLSQLPTASPEQLAEAKAQMKRLDPLNPDLK